MVKIERRSLLASTCKAELDLPVGFAGSNLEDSEKYVASLRTKEFDTITVKPFFFCGDRR